MVKFIGPHIRGSSISGVAGIALAYIPIKIGGEPGNISGATFDLRIGRRINVQEACIRSSGTQEWRILAKRYRIPRGNRSRRKYSILICAYGLRRAGPIIINKTAWTRRARVKIIVVRRTGIVGQIIGRTSAPAIRYRESRSSWGRSIDDDVISQIKGGGRRRRAD